jgi:hypothetical protein
MARQEFKDGSVLLTGDDMIVALEASINHRDAYDIDCSFCKHDGDDEHCGGCTIAATNNSCNCHINPPCSKCVGSKFEASSYLINYIRCSKGRRKWECFKGDKELFDKVTTIENSGLQLSAEILSTGEVAMYIDDGMDCDENDACEICNRKDFKQVMCKMIRNFKEKR